MKHMYLCFLLAILCFLSVHAFGEQWYKGGLHTHSLWSDGDAAPEVFTAWYKEHGWHFICYTDHNTLLEGDYLKPIEEDTELTPERVQQLRDQFGDDWVEEEEYLGRLRMRLKTFEQLAERFNEPETFLVLHGEEITTFTGNPHVNAINSVERIGGVLTGNITDRIRQYIAAVHEQSREHEQPMLAVLNHPNWSDGVTVEEALPVEALRFFEVYNGHPGVNNWGNERHGYPATDRWWDIVLSLRLKDDPAFMLYGLAADDSHNYFDIRRGQANTGRGWVMVRAERLETEALLAAIDRGAFYSSTGVTLDNIRQEGARYAFDIMTAPGVTYTTRFVGTRRGFDTTSSPVLDENGEEKPRASRIYSDDIGETLATTTDASPEYTFTGDELYVRAIVVSDKEHPNPFREGDVEMAWTQPVTLD